MKRGCAVILLCLVMVSVLIGCDVFSRPHEPEEDGILVIKANIPAALTQDFSVQSILEEVTLEEMVITISKGDMTYTGVISVEDIEGEVEMVFDSLSTGNWDVHVVVTCEDGFHIAEGTEEGTVLSNITTDVEITLDLVPAQLELQVLFPEDEDIRSGRVILLGLVDDVGTIEEFFEADPGGTITFMMKDVLPRIWFINCQLYDEEDVVLYSAKAQILLLPGRITRAQVELEEGVLQIIIHWNLPPEKPGNVQASYIGNHMTISWDEVQEAIGYMVIRSTTANGQGIHLTDELIEETSIVDTYCFEGGKEYYYRVVAFNREGLSSTYSEAASVVGIHNRALYTVEDAHFYMRLAPASTFPTGKEDEGDAVVDHDFWIAETQVTYELWYEVRIWALNNGYTFFHDGREGSHGHEGEEPTEKRQEPVTRVNWYDSIVWCNALSEYLDLHPAYRIDGGIIRDSVLLTDEDAHELVMVFTGNGFRLPTSEEWELAARFKGDDSSHGAIEYPHGSGNYWTPGTYASGATDDYTNEEATMAAAWYSANSVETTQAVGQKPRGGNVLGLFDMSGNVWEWCCTDLNSQRVDRGGAHFDIDYFQQIGGVYTHPPDSSLAHRGLRVVRTQL